MTKSDRDIGHFATDGSHGTKICGRVRRQKAVRRVDARGRNSTVTAVSEESRQHKHARTRYDSTTPQKKEEENKRISRGIEAPDTRRRACSAQDKTLTTGQRTAPQRLKSCSGIKPLHNLPVDLKLGRTGTISPLNRAGTTALPSCCRRWRPQQPD